MGKKTGITFLFGVLLASVAWFNLAPIIPPPPGPGGVETEVDPVAAAVNGLLKSNGTTLSAATANTDYSNPAGVQTLIDAIHGGTYSTTATGGGALILTVSSNYVQRFTGATTKTVRLPSTASLPRTGFGFLIWNESSGNVSVQTSETDPLVTVAGGSVVIVFCTSIAAEDWTFKQISGFAPLVSPAFTGDPTAPTQSAADNSTKISTTSYADLAASIAASNALTSANTYTDEQAASGVYSPGFSGVINLDSGTTPSDSQYIRVGNVVTASGKISVDPTLGATLTSFRLTLPSASNFATEQQAGGTGAFPDTVEPVAIKARVGGDVIFEWMSVGTSAHVMYYSFTYQIVP